MNQSKFIILDRDGVINQDSPAYVKTAEEWVPIEGVWRQYHYLQKIHIKLFLYQIKQE